jgi:Zn-finger nucleic acid-binding protein
MSQGEEARIYRCGACGGPNKEGEQICAFCRADLATLRCAHCFHMNVAEHDHCGACGETLGLLRIPEASELPCPDCSQHLTQTQADPGMLLECGGCRGQFTDHALLYDLLERRQRLPRGRAPQPQNPLSSAVRYLRCPLCNDVMHRRNFGRRSGVVVDVCGAHGVWFQHGELTQVLKFVEHGGLADARRMLLGLPPPSSAEQERDVAQAVAATIARRGPGIGPAPETLLDGRPTRELAMAVLEGTMDLLEALGGFVLGHRH